MARRKNDAPNHCATLHINRILTGLFRQVCSLGGVSNQHRFSKLNFSKTTNATNAVVSSGCLAFFRLCEEKIIFLKFNSFKDDFERLPKVLIFDDILQGLSITSRLM